jgi:hypothetical protein
MEGRDQTAAGELEAGAGARKEIFEELSQHLDDRYADLQSAGATDDEAADAALAGLNEHELLAQGPINTQLAEGHSHFRTTGGKATMSRPLMTWVESKFETLI